MIPPPVTPVKGEIAVFICEAKFGGPGKDEIEGLPHLRMLIDDTILKNSSEMSRLRVSGHVYKLQQVRIMLPICHIVICVFLPCFC